jgi:hypothetical protein
MATMITAMTAAAALLFSLALATLLEELIFGGLCRCFFNPRTLRPPKPRELGKGFKVSKFQGPGRND